MWVSENFGPVLKSWKCLGLKVSFLGDFSSWSLQFWNQGLAVSQSLEFMILHVWWQIQTFRLQEGPGHPDPDPDPEHKNFVQIHLPTLLQMLTKIILKTMLKCWS